MPVWKKGNDVSCGWVMYARGASAGQSFVSITWTTGYFELLLNENRYALTFGGRSNNPVPKAVISLARIRIHKFTKDH
jgi:hypothetical protein